jgi:hypothetical protein
VTVVPASGTALVSVVNVNEFAGCPFASVEVKLHTPGVLSKPALMITPGPVMSKKLAFSPAMTEEVRSNVNGVLATLYN